MIRYRVTQAQLRKLINEEKPSWRTRAQDLTAESKREGRFVGHGSKNSGIWSEIKKVFMRLQHHKCAYCEKPMPEEEEGEPGYDKNEYDIEHYRPKNQVRGWPNQETISRREIDYENSIGRGATRGYHLLAHDPLNYVASCKTCNSPYKGDRFPIAGTADRYEQSPTKLKRLEKPLLPLPFGTWGEDPERLLTFYGPVAVPAAKSGGRNLRGRVIVDFFNLNGRADLVRQRANLVALLFPYLEMRRLGTASPQVDDFLEAALSDGGPFASCARAFADLHDTELAKAQVLHLACLGAADKKVRDLVESLVG
ncbi:hypothetical protein OAX78_00595 [Planctomycetota bacterium]|nr:hypothetical protein [Planctomycetota bacterium]